MFTSISTPLFDTASSVLGAAQQHWSNMSSTTKLINEPNLGKNVDNSLEKGAGKAAGDKLEKSTKDINGEACVAVLAAAGFGGLVCIVYTLKAVLLGARPFSHFVGCS